ncbi:MAG: CehA/McbA family metallohydrolase [Thermoplasmata archaeon]
MSGGTRLDLHVHSMRSPDSRLTLDEIAGHLSYTGMRGFALTDHNTVAGHAALAELRSKYPGYLFLPGVEVSTVEGHLLAYGVHDAPPPHRPVLETIEWVRDHGGEPVLSHPFRHSHGVGRRIAESAPVWAIETRNGHNSEIANLRAEELAARRSLGGTGGSDVHAITDLGRAYTEFDEGVESVDDLLENLRRRSTTGDGKSMTVRGRLRLAARTTLLRAGRGFRPI